MLVATALEIIRKQPRYLFGSERAFQENENTNQSKCLVTSVSSPTVSRVCDFSDWVSQQLRA